MVSSVQATDGGDILHGWDICDLERVLALISLHLRNTQKVKGLKIQPDHADIWGRIIKIVFPLLCQMANS